MRSLSPAAFPTSSPVMSSPVPGILTSSHPFLSGKRQKVKAADSAIMSFLNVGCHLPTCTSPSPLLSRAGKTGSKVPIKRNHSEELSRPCALSVCMQLTLLGSVCLLQPSSLVDLTLNSRQHHWLLPSPFYCLLPLGLCWGVHCGQQGGES